MATKTIQHDLPEELLVNTFKLLSDSSMDIKACRAVCRTFNRCCSQFLLSRVVFAKRLDVLKRLEDMLDGPNDGIRNGVTELVYDASHYGGTKVLDFQKYSDKCEINERKYTTASKGYDDYRGRHKEQSDIEQDHLDTKILHRAFKGLKKLHRIVFTDLRSLALPGEDYPSLCDRLFGQTLEPDEILAQFSFPFDFGLCAISDAVDNAPGARVQELRIGGHPFESAVKQDKSWPNGINWSLYPCVIDGPRPHFQQVTALPLPLRYSDQPQCDAFIRLRKLRLSVAVRSNQYKSTPFNYTDHVQGTAARGMLSGSEPTLVHLSLAAVNLLMCQDRIANLYWSHGVQCIDALLLDLTFPFLRHLELEWWPLPDEELFRDFLSRHAGTLKVLKLDRCGVFGDPRALARWAGKNLHLDGVRLRLLPVRHVFVPAEEENLRDWDDVELERLCLDGRSNSLTREPEGDPQDSSVVEERR